MKEALIYTVVPPRKFKRKSKGYENISGQRFGKMVAIEFLGLNSDEKPIWRCKCDCGNENAKGLASQLKRGIRKSCGCAKKALTHGMSRNPQTRAEYRVFERLIQRTKIPKLACWKNYGGRGIKMAQEWDHPSKFPAFYEHIGPRPTPQHCVERVDNNKGYEPGNVIWATRAVEMRNTRRTVRITFRGETLCRKDMAAKYGVPDWTLKKRLQTGWTLEDALTIPVMSRWEHEKRKSK